MLIYYHFKQTQAKYFLCQVQNQINYVRIKTEIDSTSKIIADGDYSHEIKKYLLLERKAMTNLDSILKSRDVTLLTKVHLVKAMVFPKSCMGVRVGL